MAVLEAVRGWEELAGVSHIGTTEEVKEGEAKEKEEAVEVTEDLEPGTWTADQLNDELDALLEADHVSLLFEHEEHVQSPAEGSLRE